MYLSSRIQTVNYYARIMRLLYMMHNLVQINKNIGEIFVIQYYGQNYLILINSQN